MLYVVELRGAVKALTNAGAIVELTSMPTVSPPVDQMASGDQQSGMAGICLAPDHGMDVATFVYPDDDGVLRNDVVLLDTGPELSTTVVEERRLTDLFAADQSVSAHQIGGCDVVDDRVYIGVGDGGNATAVSDPQVLLGKVLCLYLDGSPCPDNPWAADGGRAAYVLAQGFRNPFGVRVLDGEVFVAENGVSIDRFLRVRPGTDHLWNGSDTSIATGAEIVFDPAVSPVQLDLVPQDHPLGHFWGDHFVISVFNAEPTTGVLGFAYDRERGRVASVPRFLVQYVGDEPQHVVAAGVGRDGLYLAGALPGADGTSALLRVHADGAAHPVEITSDWGHPTDERFGMLQRHGCVSCHTVDGVGSGIGPSLDRFGLNFRLGERLNADGYDERIAALNATDDDAERVAAREIRDVLVADQQAPLTTRAIRFATEHRQGLGLGFVGGVGATLVGLAALALLLRLRRARRRQPSA